MALSFLPPLDLSSIEGFVLTPKNSWKYLDFIFDRKLSFYQHIDFYFMSYASPPSGNYIPTVISSPNYTILPFTAATFLATHLMAVLQPSGYSIFHGRDTPIQLGFLWWSYFCQCLNTETSAWGNKSFTTETSSISYTIHLYIRLVVTL